MSESLSGGSHVVESFCDPRIAWLACEMRRIHWHTRATILCSFFYQGGDVRGVFHQVLRMLVHKRFPGAQIFLLTVFYQLALLIKHAPETQLLSTVRIAPGHVVLFVDGTACIVEQLLRHLTVIQTIRNGYSLKQIEDNLNIIEVHIFFFDVLAALVWHHQKSQMVVVNKVTSKQVLR